MTKFLTLCGVVFLFILFSGAIAAAYLFAQPGGSIKEKAGQLVGGESRLLDYLGTQLVGIANAQLVPELSFETIRYEPPFTVSLGGVRLTAPDGTDVLDLGDLTVTLAEVPKVGEPIRIASIGLRDGAVNLIRDESVGGLRGFAPLIEPGPRREQAARAQPEFKLSNVLVLNRLTIDAVDLVYDAGDGSEPMRLDALSADLDIVQSSGTEEGWYELAFSSGREPGLELDVDGRLNIDTFELVLDAAVARTTLDNRTANTLPQQLASIVSRYQLRGELRTELTGRVPLLEPAETALDIRSTLVGGRGVFGDYQIPLETVELDARLDAGMLDVDSLSAAALGGTLDIDGRVVFGGDVSIGWNLSGMQLQELLASRPADRPPALAGVMASNGHVRFALGSPTGDLSGVGDIDIRNGRLADVPVLTDLIEVMEVAGVLQGDPYRDAFASPLTFSPAGVTLEGFEFTTPAVDARGSGTIGYTGSLDLRINGGPVEALQNKMGDFGRILGIVTDSVLTYRVEGTVSEPEVAVQPFGIGG
ncbi:MAG: AsmA-like C-terminal region-containing protein [Planctomycetota bacterium]